MIQQWCDQRGYTCVTQDTIFNVIAAVDAVVNRVGCITELDAMLQGVPVVSFGMAEDVGLADRPSCQSVSELLEYATTDQFFTHQPDDAYIELCGLHEPATENVARAIVGNVPTMPNDVIPVKNIVMLQKAIFEHGWHNSSLDLLKGAVGKTTIISYINTWEERL
jgi:hypothetical protein